MESNQIVRKL